MLERDGQLEVSDIRSGRKASLIGSLGLLKLDQKRRLTLPAKWRDKHGHPSYVYVAENEFERCLDVFVPVLIEERMEAHLCREGMTRAEQAEAKRRISMTFQPVDVDAQGRIRIGDGLLAYAGLAEQASANAVGDRMELWKPEAGGEERAPAAEAKTSAHDMLRL